MVTLSWPKNGNYNERWKNHPLGKEAPAAVYNGGVWPSG